MKNIQFVYGTEDLDIEQIIVIEKGLRERLEKIVSENMSFDTEEFFRQHSSPMVKSVTEEYCDKQE